MRLPGECPLIKTKYNACLRVLEQFGFSAEACRHVLTRGSTYFPEPCILPDRISALCKGLSLGNRPNDLIRIICMWPQILQYQCNRASDRIKELMRILECNRGEAVAMLRLYPSIIGLSVDRIARTVEILRHIGADPVRYPQAFLLSPEVLRGRCVILHGRGTFDIPSGMLFQPGHDYFCTRTRCNLERVRSADPGQVVFLTIRFCPSLRIAA